MNSDLNAEKSCEEKSIRRNNSASLYPPPRPPRHRRLSSGGHAVEKEQRQSGNQARLLTGSLQESLLRSDSHCQDQYYSLRSDFMSSNKINNRLITNQLYEVKPKQVRSGVSLGGDVFSLIVRPGYDQAFVMGLIVVLDQLIPSHS